jgi:hypothetical protein
VNPRVTGNWQFTATFSAAGASPFSIAGTVKSGAPASGILHIDNPNCFDPLMKPSVGGTISADTTAVAVTGTDGQVVTLSGSFDAPSYDVVINDNVSKNFTGTYKVDGGCAAGDHGTVTGQYVYSIGPHYDPFQWTGTFTRSSTQQMVHATGTIVESSSSNAGGSFGISGDATFDMACLSAGTMKTGTYPSGSFILGTSVGLEFDLSNGTLIFLGTLNQDTNQISGSYMVSGSSCDQSGTAVVSIPTGCPGCWD